MPFPGQHLRLDVGQRFVRELEGVSGVVRQTLSHQFVEALPHLGLRHFRHVDQQVWTDLSKSVRAL